MNPRGHVDVSRSLRTFVLAAWAAYFAYLHISGEVSRYLGPRTYWVVPFGALTLGAAAGAHLFLLRRREPSPPPSVREIVGHAVLLAPLLAVLVIPAPQLGALAAGKKSTGGVASASSIVPPDPYAGRDVSFLEIHYANESHEFADAMGISDGYEVSLTGFVTRAADAPPGAFELTRFYVSCCAADAIPYSVVVEDARVLPVDTWVTASGHLEQRSSHLVLVPDRIERIGEPDDPYMY